MFLSYQQYMNNLIFLHPSQYFQVFVCFSLVILISVWLHLALGLICISLVVGDVEMEEKIRTMKSFDTAL